MKMTEAELLQYLEGQANGAFRYWSGKQAEDRERALREYLREPYGNEEDGRSAVVASDVFDLVEGMLPDLVEVFVGSDEAVRFDPVGPEDQEGAKQATAACNYVFFKQNNGFHILYEAAKDGLLLKVGAVKWFWEEKRTPEFTYHRGVPELQLAAHLAANPDVEVIEQDEREAQGTDALGQPVAMRVFDVRLKRVTKKGRVRVCSFPSDELRVNSDHDSILLADARYVAHVTRRTLSDIKQMGFRVSADDVRAASQDESMADRELRDMLREDDLGQQDDDAEGDEAQVCGWLREEYVLCDFDGDGIAERRRVIRLGSKILENEECSHVQIAAWSPILFTHQFAGMSQAELASDFQRISTEIWRQSLDSLQLANNQETVVLTDSTGNPLANLDDLLNRRPGGVIRERSAGAVRPFVEQWSGLQAMPMIELLQGAKENRTGYTRYSQGLDGDSLNKTATGVRLLTDASQKRMKLMARIMAEAMVAPMFRGIFKTLTDYCMEKLAFRLNGQFVQYDPQEWRDAYDMTVNVGIGTGDKQLQMAMLGTIEQAQGIAVQGGGMGVLVTPQNLYNLQKRKVELAGFKDANEFWTQPPQQLPQRPPPPDPRVQLESAKMQQADRQFAEKQRAEADKWNAEAAFKADQAERDRQFQMLMKRMEQQDAAIAQARAQEPANAAISQLAQQVAELQQVVQGLATTPRVKRAEAVKTAEGKWQIVSVEAPPTMQ